MIIRKKYRFEAAHIVRQCSSEKCRENIHGHSYIVEVFFKGNALDNGCMLLDFGKLGSIKELIDSFDHSFCVWNKESETFKDTITSLNKRIVLLPLSPSTEGLALVFFVLIQQLLSDITMDNGEGIVALYSVRVHETETGYAEAFEEDLAMANFKIDDVVFSQNITDEWKLLKL